MLKSLEELVNIIRERKNSSPEKSYTSKLLKDKKLNVTKVNEEVKELLNGFGAEFQKPLAGFIRN